MAYKAGERQKREATLRSVVVLAIITLYYRHRFCFSRSWPIQQCPRMALDYDSIRSTLVVMCVVWVIPFSSGLKKPVICQDFRLFYIYPIYPPGL